MALSFGMARANDKVEVFVGRHSVMVDLSGLCRVISNVIGVVWMLVLRLISSYFFQMNSTAVASRETSKEGSDKTYLWTISFDQSMFLIMWAGREKGALVGMTFVAIRSLSASRY